MATTGEVSWPPPGNSQWPLTHIEVVKATHGLDIINVDNLKGIAEQGNTECKFPGSYELVYELVNGLERSAGVMCQGMYPYTFHSVV